jgi:hypothetical protein
MTCSSFSFGSSLIGYLCNSFNRSLILDVFLHLGVMSRQVLCCLSVCFLYIVNSILVFFRCIVRFRKLMELFIFFLWRVSY